MLTYIYTLDYDDRDGLLEIMYTLDHDDREPALRETEKGSHEVMSIRTLSLIERESRYSRIVNNVAVYTVSQKYDLLRLKTLTMNKFHQLVLDFPDNSTILSVVKIAFGTSSGGYSSLRTFVLDYCTHFAGEYIHDERVNSMIKDHSELGLGMLQRMHARHLEEKWQLSRKIKHLQSRENVVFSRWQDMKARLFDLKSMAESMHIPNKTSDASTPSQAQKSLKRLHNGIRQLHTLASIESLEDTGLGNRSPA